MLDIFNNDAFSLTSLTGTISEMDHVPGRAGELAFAGVGEGVATTSAALERLASTLSLIQTSARGGPAPQETNDKRQLINFNIPQIKLEDTIPVHSVQNVRAFGSNDQMQGMVQVINQQMAKMSARHDLTLEHHRLGALKGIILDADGSTLLNLFTAFGGTAPATISMKDILAAATEDTGTEDLGMRAQGHLITRLMKRALKGMWPGSARIWAFAGDNFFDRLVESTDVEGVYSGYDKAERRLGDNYAHGVFEFGGVFYENYQGTDDNSTVAINTNECQFFPVGVPGLYQEFYAPGDFEETVNTIGLPRYAKLARDPEFGRWVKIHTQQNPLPLCTKPSVLLKGSIA